MPSTGGVIGGNGLYRALSIISCLALVAVVACHDAHDPTDLRSSLDKAPEAEVVTDAGRVRLDLVTPGIVRVRISPDDAFEPDDSWAVVARERPPVPHALKDLGNRVRVETDLLAVEVVRSPHQVILYDAAGNAVSLDLPGGLSWEGEGFSLERVMPPGEHYYGFGEKAWGLDRRGARMTMWNTDTPGYQWGTDPIYQSIPLFLALRHEGGPGGPAGDRDDGDGRFTCHGLFLDNTFRTFFDMGHSRPDSYLFGAEGGELDYYLIGGPGPVDVLEGFAELTGTMPLPPLWALGFHQCRYSYYPEREVRRIASTMRAKRIPCDAIWLDIHYMDGYRIFTWDPDRFPDLPGLVADLRRSGFRTVTMIDPGVKVEPGYWVDDAGRSGGHFCARPDGTLYVGRVWPGPCHFPDFTSAWTRAWWGSLYHELVSLGIAGFWNDMNEPSVMDSPTKTMDPDVFHCDRGRWTDHRRSHNVYGMLMARASFEGLRALRPEARPFVLTRAAFAGTQRYAATWTGDNTASWDHLRLSFPMCLGLGLSGQPFSGPDVGGFILNPSAELFARWIQAGVFYPFYRVHTTTLSLHQEPWSYGPRVERIARDSIELRYRLLPYLYTEFRRASLTGVPAMRPLFVDYPGDPETYREETEFLFGSDLLVAPVVHPRCEVREVYLPAGTWYELCSGRSFLGPGTITVEAPLEVLPLLARGGSVIPMRDAIQYVGERPIDPLILEVFPSSGGHARGRLYEDAGDGYGYRDGDYRVTAFELAPSAQGLLFTQAPIEGIFQPPDRSLLMKLHGRDSAPSGVSVGPAALPERSSVRALLAAGRGWIHEPGSATLWIRLDREESRGEVELRITSQEI